MPPTLAEFIEEYKKGFGGGMIPFDSAYNDAIRDGSSIIEAQRLGVHAVLDAILALHESYGNYRWADRMGMPIIQVD